MANDPLSDIEAVLPKVDDTSRPLGRVRRSALIVATAMIYASLGLLGLSIAIAPGYASPIFPASGFAVAILLWSNNRAWPGIWLGSFILNAVVTLFHGKLELDSTFIAVGVASGAAVQALAARKLVLRTSPLGWQSLELERDIIRCLVVAGPMACTLSATIGVSVLYFAGRLGDHGYLYAWWTWWSGDTLGVLVMFPLSLTLLFHHRRLWHGRLSTLVIPMSITIGLVGIIYYAVAQWELSEQKSGLASHGERLAQLFKQRFVAHQEALSALRRLWEVTPAMTYGQFEYFTRITLKDNPDIFALSINPYVTAGQRHQFEEEMAEHTGTPGFEIKERDASKRLVRAAERSEYVSVAFIAPLKGNTPAVGYDINSEPLRHDAIQRAQRSGAPAVTAPIHLVQENQERTGVLLLHPAYQTIPSANQPTQVHPELMGFAVGVIKIDEMVSIATGQAAIEGIKLEIDDASADRSGSVLYRSDDKSLPSDSALVWQTRVRMADRLWDFRVYPTPAFIRQQNHWLAFVIGAGGLTLSALLQMLLLVTTGRTAIVERTVREQTAELRARRAAVEDRNAQLNALFSLSPDAFIAFAPDGRIKFANPAFQEMTGITNGEIADQDESVLDAALRARTEEPERYPGVASFFGGFGEISPKKILTLHSPRNITLQIVGVLSESPSVSRILYLRDVTREAEVDRMKSEFLSHAAHELRTPMTSIFGFSELLLERDLDDETRRDLLETIHRQTKWLVDIINELLDLSRIDSRQGQDIHVAAVDLRELVRNTVADIGVDHTRWPVLLDLPDQASAALADPAKLRQALINVLSNARKYSPHGGEIRIALIEEPNNVGIVIADKGIGMTPAQLTHLGERFWRADTSGKTPGSGLGMAIVKELITLLGGRVDVISQKNLGTTVTLWLPVAK